MDVKSTGLLQAAHVDNKIISVPKKI
jgi:hypothetical protein